MKIHLDLNTKGSGVIETYEPIIRSKLSMCIFRKNVRTLRMRLRLSKTEVAKRSGMTYKSYNEFEDGETFPKGETLIAVSHALGCTFEELSCDFI